MTFYDRTNWPFHKLFGMSRIFTAGIEYIWEITVKGRSQLFRSHKDVFV